MPHGHFHRRLHDIESGVLDLGAMVDRQLQRAMQSLVDRDVPLADAVIRDDGEINRSRFHLENMCASLLASVSELERMGDHAEGIARIVLMAHEEPPIEPIAELSEIALRAGEILR